MVGVGPSFHPRDYQRALVEAAVEPFRDRTTTVAFTPSTPACCSARLGEKNQTDHPTFDKFLGQFAKCAFWKAALVLYPCQPFFLKRENEASILYKRRGGPITPFVINVGGYMSIIEKPS